MIQKLCDEIIKAMDSVSTNVTNISANVTSSMLTKSDDKKVRYKMDCYTLHKVLPVITLLFTIATIYYHYTKHRAKPKNIMPCK